MRAIFKNGTIGLKKQQYYAVFIVYNTTIKNYKKTN